MKKLRIAIVSPYPPSTGTLNEYAYHFVNNMKENAEVEEIILITDKLPENKKYTPENGVAKITVKEVWSFNALTNFWKIRKAVKESNPDVVFYNIQFLSFGDKKVPATLGLLTPLITKLSGYPSVVMLHNIIETVDYASAGITNNPVMKWIYNAVGTILTRLVLSADMVTVTIAKYVEILEAKYGVKNVALVPHGTFELPPMPEFESTNKVKQIMTFGKFGTYKKVEEMIEAVEIIRERTDEKLEIVIAGTDNPNVKGYLADVQEKYSHVPGLHFTGYVEEEDVPVIFGESDVVVFPYTSTTGSSGVLHQAGSYGKAVVLPNIGDLKELIEEEGYQGNYFLPGDVASLADAIQELVQDDNKRVALAKKNYSAAAGLPLQDLMEWYKIHFRRLIKKDIKVVRLEQQEEKRTKMLERSAV